MFKLGFYESGEEVEYLNSGLYKVENNCGYERTVLGLSTSHIGMIIELLSMLNGPFYVLYVLHTPRTGIEPGRYQSKAITFDEVGTLLKRFTGFFEQDSRHDLWVHSPKTNMTIVYDRHNLIYLYGISSEQVSVIERKGMEKRALSIPVPHVHHYYEEYDVFESQIISDYEWVKSALRDEDRQ